MKQNKYDIHFKGYNSIRDIPFIHIHKFLGKGNKNKLLTQ